MTTRFLIGYVLLGFLLAGVIGAIWWMIRNTERNVRRRERRKRKARYRAGLAASQPSLSDEREKAD